MRNTRRPRKPLPFLEERFLPCGEDEEDGRRIKLLRTLRRLTREQLSEKQRLAVELYYGQGMTVRAIAAMRGVAPSTVSRTLRRAEAELKRYLEYLF